MNLLSWGATTNRPSGVALIFGSGLVGGAVVRSLQTASPGLSVRQLDWNWADLGAVDAATVEQAALDALESRRDARFSVVWAAGRSGFGSDDADMRREDAALQAVLETARRVGAAVPIERRAFHLVSSAGGLFEGQVAVGRDAAPRPLRPYGEGKLRQEQLVSAEDRLGRRRIYRPSSVFGYAPRARRGLIAALIAAAVQSRTARIMGSMTTQRDYVFARDVGRHISAAILSPGDAPIRTSVLAQGRRPRYSRSFA